MDAITSTEQALYAACEMAGVEHRLFKIREIIAELGEQGYAIVPTSTHDAVLAMPKGGQPSLFEFTEPSEYPWRVAMLRSRVTYGVRCPNMRDHVTQQFERGVLTHPLPTCDRCTSTISTEVTA